MNCRTTAAATLSLLLSLAPEARAIDAGVARIDVTPPEPIRLTGYGNRKTNSIGVEQKLWAKALALGSDREGPALLITLDNCGIAESTYRELVARLTKQTKLKQTGIVVACSHTHSGPCTTDWAPNIFSSDIPPEQQAVLDRYTRVLITNLTRIALAALNDRRPAQLAWAQGEVGFARNRRVVVGNTANFGANAAGPVDHALPVLRVTAPDGRLRAIVANYACHCTTLGGEFNHVCGDWAGYAQEAIERDQPDAVALITIGCGADANPYPRGGNDAGLALAQQHGEELAAEVKRLLGQNFTPLTGKLSTQLKEIRLPFGTQFTREEWQARSTKPGIEGYHARKWLARLDRGEKAPNSLYYPISSWRFGDELALVFLPGEVVVDYALRLKRDFDPARLWVSSYSLYVPCYIPSRRILAEGGYEAEQSLWYYDRPTRLSTNAEDLIIKTVHELVPKPFLFDKRKAEFPDPLTPKQALGTFRTHPDIAVELVASEPLIESPVAIDWDARGRLWVCEMYDYPSGLKPPPEQDRKWGEPIQAPPGGFTPGGRIKILTSSKGDGHYDKATLFLDKLSFPTGVFPWRNGALICAAPDILYAEDTDGDGRADVVRTNFTGFATHNYQARVNGFRWGLDGWLHGSSGLFGGKVKSRITGREVDLGGRDFRIKPDTGEIEPLAGISQMGRVRDDFDNWFGNDNSTLLWHYPLPEHYMRRNPYVTYPDPRVNVGQASRLSRERASASSQNGDSKTESAAPAQAGGTPTLRYDPSRVFPVSRALERFNSPESVNHITSACGIDIYRDVLLGTNYHGNAFICEPVHNLVTRLVLEPDGVTFAGHRAGEELQSEFLASTDNWFRPVQVRTGPDGALWVVDMYRFVIEHPRWIAPERLKELDIRAGADKGRIYRVYPKGATLRLIKDFTKLGNMDLVQNLDTPNGSARDAAHQEIARRYEELVSKTRSAPRQNPPAEQWLDALHLEDQWRDAMLHGLGKLSALSPLPASRIHALAVIDALQKRAGDFFAPLKQTLVDAHPGVRSWAAQLLCRSDLQPFLAAELTNLVNDPDPVVRFRFALALSEDPDSSRLLGRLAVTKDRWIRAAVLTAATNNPGTVFETLLAHNPSMDGEFAGQLMTTAALAAYEGHWQGMMFDITPPPGFPTQTWHWVALRHLFDALERKHVSPASLAADSKFSSHHAAERIRLCLARAQFVAGDTNADESMREAAIRLLKHDGGDANGQLAALSPLLRSGTPTRLQAAAMDTLRHLRGTRVAHLLLKDWNQNSPTFRATVIGLLMSRDEWMRELLKAVEERRVGPNEIPLAGRQTLLKHKEESLRKQAESLFGAHPSTSRAEILAKFNSAASLSAAPDRGPALFDKNCAQCHAYRGHGHAVGPNLAEYAGKSIADFVQAILDPNSAINPNFLAYNIDTQDGRSLTGIVRGETSSGFTLVQGGGIAEKILRTDLKELRASSISLMPEGLEQALSPQDIADVIAWIQQGAPASFGAASANPTLAARNRDEFVKAGSSSLTKLVTAAETLPYRSWLGTFPMPYCRQMAGVNRLAWQADPRRKPAGAATAGVVTFRFPAAMGFASQPQGKFTLQLDGRSVLDFNVALADSTWSSADGRVAVIYAVMEANSEDSNGLLAIEVSSSLIKPNEPVRFEVTGSPSDSQRWFGIYLTGDR